MPRKSFFHLRFPLGGLNRRVAYRQQPPFTSPDCINVRPDAALEGRSRGGSRPGLGKAFYEELGSGAPVRLLADVAVAETNGFACWTDNFLGDQLGPLWSVASWVGTVPFVMGEPFGALTYSDDVGAVRDVLPIDTGQAYCVQVFIEPRSGQHNGSYKIFARMDDTTPDATADGIVATLTLTGTGGAYSGTLDSYVASAKTSYAFTGGNTGAPQSGWFTVLISADTISCYWLGTLLKSQAVSSHAGTRVGFGMECTVEGGVCLVDTFRCQYYEDTAETRTRHVLVASAGGEVWREVFAGQLTISTTTLTLAADRELQGAERGQKLYIADNGMRVDGTDGVIDATGLELTAAGVADWTALGIDTDDDVVVISAGTGAVTDGTYQIASVVAGKVTLAAAAGGAGNCSYSVERAPKIYDPLADTLTIWSATGGLGQVPAGCPLVCTYRDRLVLAGKPLHAWYMSRQGDPLDWDYAAEANDAGRAVAGSTAEAGLVGDPVRAVAPHTDDYLFFGCEGSLWVLRGDAAYGGQINNVSRTVGIIGQKAWCWGPAGELYFLSRDGLYLAGPGGEGGVKSLSREKVPRELLDIDVSRYIVTLEYDVRERGVHIHKADREAGG